MLGDLTRNANAKNSVQHIWVFVRKVVRFLMASAAATPLPDDASLLQEVPMDLAVSATPIVVLGLKAQAPVPHNEWVAKGASLSCGFVFGFVLHKARVYNAGVIIRQLALTEFLMLKVGASWGQRWTNVHVG